MVLDASPDVVDAGQMSSHFNVPAAAGASHVIAGGFVLFAASARTTSAHVHTKTRIMHTHASAFRALPRDP